MGVEVEDKEQVSPLEHNDFVSFMSKCDILVSITEPMEFLLQCVHCLVPCFQSRVPQITLVTQTPLSSAVVVTRAIAFSWEINPFRMSKFVTHKIEVGFST